MLTLQILNLQLTGQLIFDISKVRTDCIHEFLVENMVHMQRVTYISIFLWALYPIFLTLAIASYWEGPRMYAGITISILMVCARCNDHASLPHVGNIV